MVLPIREGEEKKAAAEQEINPWDVQAAIDEHGNPLAFDYEAISKYVQFSSHRGAKVMKNPILTELKEVGDETYRRRTTPTIRASYGSQTTPLVKAGTLLLPS